MMISRRSLLAASAAAYLAPLNAAAQNADVRPVQTIRVDGRDRLFRLVAPSSAGRSPPLMIALHGMGIDSISLMPAYSGLDDLARAVGAILMYPAALNDHWPLSFGAEMRTELRFFDALMRHAHAEHGIDPRRIYLLGMSNGGYFAVVTASRRSRFLAGLAVHSGTAGVLGFGFETERKFPVFVAHGAEDRIIPPRDGRYLADLMERQGHPSEYAEYPGLGHLWARDQGVNERIWRFWQDNPA